MYNSLTRQVEALEPVTRADRHLHLRQHVYRYAHIGNLRTYLFGDLLRRTLEYLGYEVTYVKNITDVGHMRDDQTDSGEDRMVLAALEEVPAEIAQFYTDAWLADEALINIRPPDVMPRATDHIAEMQALIETLLDKGLAYRVDGTVYYDVSAFPAYGRLSGQRVSPPGLAPGSRSRPTSAIPPTSPCGRRPSRGVSCTGPHRGARVPRLAHRVLGDGDEVPWRAVRHPHRRHRPEVPASRGRDRPVRRALGHQVISLWMHGEFLTLADARWRRARATSSGSASCPRRDSSRSTSATWR